MKQTKNRDPNPKNRDPRPEHLVDNLPTAPLRPLLTCVCEASVRCPKCRSTVSQIDGTRPEPARGFTIKYRTCKACGNKFASRQDQKLVEQWPAVEGVDL